MAEGSLQNPPREPVSDENKQEWAYWFLSLKRKLDELSGLSGAEYFARADADLSGIRESIALLEATLLTSQPIDSAAIERRLQRIEVLLSSRQEDNNTDITKRLDALESMVFGATDKTEDPGEITELRTLILSEVT